MKKSILYLKKMTVCLLICCTVTSAFMAKAPTDQRALLADAFGMTTVEAATKKTQLPSKLYKKIKGWWTDASSGGYNRKVTKTYIKAYDRTTGKLAYKSKIYGWKKTRRGYLIKLKYPKTNGKYCYVYDKKNDVLEYHFDSWRANGNNYSGSSSLFRGKWQSR